MEPPVVLHMEDLAVVDRRLEVAKMHQALVVVGTQAEVLQIIIQIKAEAVVHISKVLIIMNLHLQFQAVTQVYQQTQGLMEMALQD
jgi:predicted transposase YdaD